MQLLGLSGLPALFSDIAMFIFSMLLADIPGPTQLKLGTGSQP